MAQTTSTHRRFILFFVALTMVAATGPFFGSARAGAQAPVPPGVPVLPTLPSGCPDLPDVGSLPRGNDDRSPFSLPAQVEVASTLRHVCSFSPGKVAQVMRGYARSHPLSEVPDVLKGAGFDAQGVAEGLSGIAVDAKAAVEALKRLGFRRDIVVPAIVRAYELPPGDQPIVLAAKQREGEQIVVKGYRPERFAADLLALQSGAGTEQQVRALADAFRQANEQAQGPRAVDGFPREVVLQSLVNAIASPSTARSTLRTGQRAAARRAERRRRLALRAASPQDGVDPVLLTAVRALKASGSEAAFVLAALRQGYTDAGKFQSVDGLRLPVIFTPDPGSDDAEIRAVGPQPAAKAVRLVDQAGFDRTQIANGLVATYLQATPNAAARYVGVARLFRAELKNFGPCDTVKLLSSAFARSAAQIAGALQALKDSSVVAMNALKCGLKATSGRATQALTAGVAQKTASQEGLATYTLTTMPPALADAYKRTKTADVYADLRAAGFISPSTTAPALALTTTGKERPARLAQLTRVYRDGWTEEGAKKRSDLNPRDFATEVARALRDVKVLDGPSKAGDVAQALLDSALALADSASAVRQAYKLDEHETFMVFRGLLDESKEVSLLFYLAGTPPVTDKTLLDGDVGKRVITLLIGKPDLDKAAGVQLLKRAFSVSELSATRAYERVAQNRPDISAKDLVDTYLAAFPGTRLTKLAAELRSDYTSRDILLALLPRVRQQLKLPENPSVGDTRLLGAATGLLVGAGFPGDQALRTVKAAVPAAIPESARDALKGLLAPVGLPGDLDPSPPLKASPLTQLEGLDALGYTKCANVTAVSYGTGTTPDLSKVLANYEGAFGSLTANQGAGLSFLSDCLRLGSITVPIPLRKVTVTVSQVKLGPSTVQIDKGVLVGRIGLAWAGLDIARGLPRSLTKVPLFATDDDVEQASSKSKTVNPQDLSTFKGAVLPLPRTIVLPDVPLGSTFPVPRVSIDVLYLSRPGGYCVLPSETDLPYHAAAVLLGKDEYLALPGKSRYTNTQKYKPSDDLVAANDSSATLDVLGAGSDDSAERSDSVTQSMTDRDTCGSIRGGTFNFTATVTSKHVQPSELGDLSAVSWGRSSGTDAAGIGSVASSEGYLPNQLNKVYGDLFGWLATTGWTGSPADVAKLAQLIKPAANAPTTP